MYGLFSELPQDKKVAYGAKAQFKHGILELFYDRIDTVGHLECEIAFKKFAQHFDKQFKNICAAAHKWSTGPLCPKSRGVKTLYQDDEIVVKASMQGTKDWLYLIAYPK